MEAISSISEIAARGNTEIGYLKRHESSNHPPKPYLDKHVMSSADFNTDDCSSGEISVGGFYEIDHEKLPPKFPLQLTVIRVVTVVDKTMLNVSVKFPSMLSLSKYFCEGPGNKTGQKDAGKMHPELDEQFVMGTNVASKVLRRLIPSTEFVQQNQLESFWLVSPKATLVKKEKPSSSPEHPLLGVFQSALRCTEMVRWGVRRKVNFIGRHRDTPPPSSEFKRKESSETKIAAKRPRETPTIYDRKGKSARRKNMITRMVSSKDRWSKERYEAAELKLMDIMREKGAILGNPILRPELRAEARKHIGDTGLLDHLLKHMAGKVVPNRNERFRRRHNSEGSMEYWLERADLIELRRQAGVQDPYWAPPPGWQPGDGLVLDPVCARELKQLKEEMANMKRDFEQLLFKKHESEVDATPVSARDAQLESDLASPLQESTYKSFLKRKTQLQQQLDEISNSLNVMQGELRQLSEEATGQKKKGEAEEKPRKVVRSGFRICKPQGTFLWPNNGGSMSTQVQLQVEDLLAVPTPPSASSATSAPPLPILPGSPVKTLPKNRTIIVSCVRSESATEAHNCSTTWKHFNTTGNCASLSSPKLPHVCTDLPALYDGENEPVAESGLSQSDTFGLGTGISSGSSSTVTVADHLIYHDKSARAWLSLATTTTSS